MLIDDCPENRKRIFIEVLSRIVPDDGKWHTVDLKIKYFKGAQSVMIGGGIQGRFAAVLGTPDREEIIHE